MIEKVIIYDDFLYDFEKIKSNLDYLSSTMKHNFYKEFKEKIEYIKIFPKMYPKVLGYPYYRKMIIDR